MALRNPSTYQRSTSRSVPCIQTLSRRGVATPRDFGKPPTWIGAEAPIQAVGLPSGQAEPELSPLPRPLHEAVDRGSQTPRRLRAAHTLAAAHSCLFRSSVAKNRRPCPHKVKRLGLMSRTCLASARPIAARHRKATKVPRVRLHCRPTMNLAAQLQSM